MKGYLLSGKYQDSICGGIVVSTFLVWPPLFCHSTTRLADVIVHHGVSSHCDEFLTEFVTHFSGFFCHHIRLFMFLMDVVEITWSWVFLPAFRFLSAVLKTDRFGVAFSSSPLKYDSRFLWNMNIFLGKELQLLVDRPCPWF